MNGRLYLDILKSNENGLSGVDGGTGECWEKEEKDAFSSDFSTPCLEYTPILYTFTLKIKM